jgi:hypothetical protein
MHNTGVTQLRGEPRTRYQNALRVLVFIGRGTAHTELFRSASPRGSTSEPNHPASRGSGRALACCFRPESLNYESTEDVEV